MQEFNLGVSGRIRIHDDYVEILHPKINKARKKNALQDMKIRYEDIHHVELYKPWPWVWTWPFTAGYIRFSIDGSRHKKKNGIIANKESNSMLCQTILAYRKMEEIKRIVEQKMQEVKQRGAS